MIESFHKVDSLEQPDLRACVIGEASDCVLVYEVLPRPDVHTVVLTVPEARALLEWLRTALP